MGGQASRHLPPAVTCLAPSEFVQWPQSLSKPPGSSTVFICVAQRVPEPWLVLLKNGKGLSPGDNFQLTYNRYPRSLCSIPSTLPDCQGPLTCPRHPPLHPQLYTTLSPYIYCLQPLQLTPPTGGSAQPAPHKRHLHTGGVVCLASGLVHGSCHSTRAGESEGRSPSSCFCFSLVRIPQRMRPSTNTWQRTVQAPTRPVPAWL